MGFIEMAVFHLEPGAIRKYMFGLSAVYWALIFSAWVGYPKDHHYSIMTHTFSFLGSWADKHSPQWWWLFSVGMVTWGLGMLPVTLYLRKRLSAVSPWASWVFGFLYVVGGFGIALVGVFPDAPGEIVAGAGYTWTKVHAKVAVSAFAGFFLGNLWMGAMLLLDGLWLRRMEDAGSARFQYTTLLWPYLFWLPILCTGIGFLVKWEYAYAAKKAAAAAAGAHIGSSWSEAMNTRYSFPLWENILIYTLFLFLVWMVTALTASDPDL